MRFDSCPVAGFDSGYSSKIINGREVQLLVVLNFS